MATSRSRGSDLSVRGQHTARREVVPAPRLATDHGYRRVRTSHAEGDAPHRDDVAPHEHEKPIAWVAKQAGRSIAETERTYFHFLPTEARGAADELDDLVAPRKTRVSRTRETTATNGTDGVVIGRIDPKN
jgi:hypothetical protein